MTYSTTLITPYPLGITPQATGIHVSYVPRKSIDNCGMILYDKRTGAELRKVSFQTWQSLGKIRYGIIENIDINEVTYQFYEDDEIIPDTYARCFASQVIYGQKRAEKDLKALILQMEYDWEDDEYPRISYEDAVCYCMHVRGFTRHSSSGVRNKGTFSGVAQKLDYLKELGITTVEFQPVYEFIEMETVAQSSVLQYMAPKKEVLNYWGYKRGFYYAPKAGYAASGDPVNEFRKMVKAFHKHKMEVVLQFYFPDEVPRHQIVDILRYWVFSYHADGFHLMGNDLPLQLIESDPALADTKLWFDHADQKSSAHYAAQYRDDYMYDMRRFLKGDNDMLPAVCYQMRCNPSTHGKINYFTNYYGLTMLDMVTYNDKHNEDNGEYNLDGCDYNHSWNCGVEGPCRKKQIGVLREKQYKNAVSMLFLSQGTPLIFMGDEFGNSQRGNNNPYCQDNEIAWLDWRLLKKNRKLYEYTVRMIAFRKAHPVLRQKTEPRLMDYLAYGYPDLSYHGADAWKPSMNSLDRQIGMMYCGRYAGIDKVRDDDYIYIAMNMNWEAKELALPRLPAGLKWEIAFSTGESSTGNESSTQWPVKKVPSRTVAVFISREMKENE